MTYHIDEAPSVEKVLKKWKKSNPQIFKKYNKSIMNW